MTDVVALLALDGRERLAIAKAAVIHVARVRARDLAPLPAVGRG